MAQDIHNAAMKPEETETADRETSTDEYARRFSGAVGAWFLERQTSLVLSHVRRTPARSVIDIGGGHGQSAAPLADNGYEVTVFGSAPECVHRVSTLVSQGRCRFVSGDLINLPFPDRSFGVALSLRLLPHCTRWETLIEEMCRVSEHGVIVDYPSYRSFNIFYALLFPLKKRVEGDTRTYTIFRDGDVEAAFATCGFRRVRRSPQFFLPMVLYRKVKSPTVGRILEGLFVALGLTSFFGSPTISLFVRDA